MPATKKYLIATALSIAESGLPVFPTSDKVPSWSNDELGVSKGNGGYKIASTDPKRVRELFSHPRAKEIAVPMGEMSGLMCIDVDLHKDPTLIKWIEDNPWLHETRSHKTRSGGLHFLFKHPGDVRFPATLRSGVDVKATGNGYICWPGTEGYSVLGDVPVSKFPLDVLREVMIAKGGTGSLSTSSWNEATDEELVERIQTATDLYPALRSLSVRLSTRRMNGVRLTMEQQVATLEAVMDSSAAAEPPHKRHDDWVDRRGKIAELVTSANERLQPTFTDDEAAAIMEGKPIIDLEKLSRPIGPQRETKADDIERRVAEIQGETEFASFTLAELRNTSLPEIEWLIKGMLPVGGIASLGGTSNVGKTRWLASLAACLSVGQTELMGLPAGERSSVLWVANEEHADDIKRRIKAAAQHYGIKGDGEVISVRPKTAGTLRLVGINEVGNPELDEENIARLVAEVRRVKAKTLILDPYVTLSDAMDENSATSASMLTKAMILISTLGECAVFHAHHTPKDRSHDADWYRADSGAWRGSGAIYSSLDCGFTLAPWMPTNKERRKTWKAKYLEADLGRWIVLDTGKIREGKPLQPVVYELVGERLPEGYDIGVCHVSSPEQAEQCLLHDGDDAYLAGYWAGEIALGMGVGVHHAADIDAKFHGKDGWPLTDRDTEKRQWKALTDLFEEPVLNGNFEVTKHGRKAAIRVGQISSSVSAPQKSEK
jgi:RecA-family ATPase